VVKGRITGRRQQRCHVVEVDDPRTDSSSETDVERVDVQYNNDNLHEQDVHSDYPDDAARDDQGEVVQVAHATVVVRPPVDANTALNSIGLVDTAGIPTDSAVSAARVVPGTAAVRRRRR